jgi:hypothetical protein
MGGGGDPEDLAECTGLDVLQDLDEVFGHPNSKKYQDAKSASLALFQKVPYGLNNFNQLYDAYVAAYRAAGVSMCANWQPYLATLSPDNVSLIAGARSQALAMNWPMTTKTHDPHQGGPGVVVSSGNGSVTIDSPYAPTYPYRNRRR